MTGTDPNVWQVVLRQPKVTAATATQPVVVVGVVRPVGRLGVLAWPGPAGPPGPPGPSTTGGVRRWHGNGPPGLLVGAQPNDEYLDLSTGDLYLLT